MEFKIRRCPKDLWEKFRKYHYLDSNLNKAAHTYAAYLRDKRPVAFIAVLHQPHPKSQIKRVHRLVVLPEFQGIGLGTKLLEKVGKHYVKQGYKYTITSSNPALTHALKKRRWKLKSKGRKDHRHEDNTALRKSRRKNAKRNTLSWEYHPKDNLS